MTGTGSPHPSSRSVAPSAGAATTPPAAFGGGCTWDGQVVHGDGTCPAGLVRDACRHEVYEDKILTGQLTVGEGGAVRACRPPPDGFDDILATHDHPTLGNPFSLACGLVASFRAYDGLIRTLLDIDAPLPHLAAHGTARTLDGHARLELGRAVAAHFARAFSGIHSARVREFDWAALRQWLLEHARLIEQGHAVRLLCHCWDERVAQAAPPLVCHTQTLAAALATLARRVEHAASASRGQSKAPSRLHQVRTPRSAHLFE
jgi:hypothetical protein